MAAYQLLTLAVLAGVAAGIVPIGLMEATVRYIPEASPWKSTVSDVLTSLSPLVPGLIAGYLAPRSGFTAGALASAVTSILGSAYVALIVTRSVTEPLHTPAIPEELTYVVVSLIVGGVCGIAGAAVAREKRNAF